MKLVQNILKKAGFIKVEDLINKRGKSKLKGNRPFRFEASIDDLDTAINMALNEISPSRIMLYSIYKNNVDLHIKSQMRTSIFKVISNPFALYDAGGKIHEKATQLFQKQWFDDLNKIYLQTEFWGHSLPYFELLQNGEIAKVKIIPRMHVNPEKGVIIPDLDFPDRHLYYKEEPFLSYFLEMGKAGDLGLLADLCRMSILKMYSLQDWARTSEGYGDPHLVIQSDDHTDEKEEFAKNFANNKWLLTDLEDKITLLEQEKSNGGHKLFLDFIQLANDECSKGINGQVATSEQKSFVGSAEVQERILNDYTKSRLRSLMFYHNEVTIPFLINYNGGQNAYRILKGLTWKPIFENEVLDEEATEDNKSENKNQPENKLQNPFI